MKGKLLVAGASGLVGHAAIERFCRLGWEVVGVSRRRPADLPKAELVSVDLLDREACAATFSNMGDVTHVVYAAVSELPGLWAGWIDEENIERNGRMLQNMFDPLLNVATRLQHVSLLHGTKAYGVHHPSIGPSGAPNPLRERAPRKQHPNFYFLQEDYLRAAQAKGDWGLTVFRPTVIYGGAWGNNLNPLPVLAAYAALLRDDGEPLHFPGGEGFQGVREAVDTDLVATALSWAPETRGAHGGTFNLTNGDTFTWPGVWPAIADTFGMKVGEQRPVSLREELPKRADQWAELVQRYELRAPRSIVEFVGENSLIYTDMLLRGTPQPTTPLLNSTVHARKVGFQDCMDTEDMFRKWFTRLHDTGVVPPRSS